MGSGGFGEFDRVVHALSLSTVHACALFLSVSRCPASPLPFLPPPSTDHRISRFLLLLLFARHCCPYVARALRAAIQVELPDDSRQGVLNDVIPYGLSTGNRNSLQGLNLIGLRRAKFENKDILGLSEAYKEIFGTKNINENISKLNGSFQENPLVKDVIKFITKDKKRSICTPFS